MRRVLILIPFMALLLAGASPWLEKGEEPAVGPIGQQWGGAGGFLSAALDTVRILSTHSTYPNNYIAEPDSYFTTVNKADDGSALRYGFVLDSAPSTVQVETEYIRFNRTVSERTTAAPTRIAFVWCSLNGLKQGMHVTRADFLTSISQSQEFDVGGYFAVRADTILSDYSMLDYASQQADPCYLDISYGYKSTSDTSDPWDPALSDRDRMFYYGPRSIPMPSDEFNHSYGDSNITNVIDAIQQIVDRGQEAIDLGVIFVLYVNNATYYNWHISAGNLPVVGGGRGGNPALIVEAETRRGDRPWDDYRQPIALTWDDAKPRQVDYFSIASQYNVPFDLCVTSTYWPTKGTGLDSLYSVAHDSINWIHHTYNHDNLGASDTDIDLQLRRESSITSDVISAMPDYPDTTAGSMAFAWAGGEPNIYAKEALWKVSGYGYKGARGVGYDWVGDSPTSEVFASSYPGLDNYVNIYNINSPGIANLFTKVDETKADIRARLYRIADQHWQEGGRAGVVFYGHGDDNYVSDQNLTYLMEIIDETFWMKYVSFDYILDELRSHGLVANSTVVTNLADSFNDSYRDSMLGYQAYLTADSLQVFVDALVDSCPSCVYENNLQYAWAAPVSESVSTVTLPTTPEIAWVGEDTSSISLYWDTYGVDKWNVYKGTDSDTLSLLALGYDTQDGYTDTSVVYGTTYYYAIQAMDDGGYAGDRSSVVSGATYLPEEAVTITADSSGYYLAADLAQLSVTASEPILLGFQHRVNAGAWSSIAYVDSAVTTATHYVDCSAYDDGDSVMTEASAIGVSAVADTVIIDRGGGGTTSYLFSNSTTAVSAGSYDVSVTSGMTNIETSSANPDSVVTAEWEFAFSLSPGGYGFPLPGNGVAAFFFNVADTLAGKTVTRATLHLKVDTNAITATKCDTLRIMGANTANLAAWTAASDGCWNYSVASTTTPWATAMSSMTSWGLWGVACDTLITSDVAIGTWLSIDVTDAVSAWAGGDPEGGFWFFGRSALQWESPNTTRFCPHIETDASERPYLEVYTSD